MPKTSRTEPLVRAYAHGVTVRLGLISIVGSLYPIQKGEKEVKASFASPDHNPVTRVYKDAVTGRMYDESELARSVSTADGVSKIVDAAALKALRQSEQTKNLMDVTIHPIADISQASFPSNHSAYLFQADPASAQAANFLIRALDDEQELAVMGVMNLRHYEGLYRLLLWRNQLVIQRYMFADDVQPHDTKDLPAESKQSDLLRQVMAKLVKPFDAATYRNEQTIRIREAVQVLEVTGALTPVKRTEVEESDLMSELESYLKALDGGS